MNNIKYRSDIDGLRALAVVSVILYHLEISWVKSGFLGVDIFFVISGYLITSITLRDLQNNSFSIKNFYLRRIRRILPALIFVLVLSTFFCMANTFTTRLIKLCKINCKCNRFYFKPFLF